MLTNWWLGGLGNAGRLGRPAHSHPHDRDNGHRPGLCRPSVLFGCGSEASRPGFAPALQGFRELREDASLDQWTRGTQEDPGCASLPFRFKNKDALLEEISVSERLRGRGIGKKLVGAFSKRFGRHSPTYLSPQAEHQDPASYASFYAFVKPDVSGGPSAVLDTPGTAPTPDNKNIPALERFWRLAGFTRVGSSRWVACYCSYYMLAPATIRRPSLPEILGQSAWPSPPWRYSRMSKTAQAASWCCQRVLPDSFDIIKKPMVFSTI